jgi:hypothetical protein
MQKIKSSGFMSKISQFSLFQKIVLGWLTLIAALLLAVLFVVLGPINSANLPPAGSQSETITDFAGCQRAGYSISESYPRQCTDKAGITHREPLETVQPPYDQVDKKRGKVTKIDITAYTQGVDGIIEIETQPQMKFTYYIGSGGSPDCDRSLIGMARSNEIKPGDTVEVSAKLAGLKPEPGKAVNDIGFYSVCDEGTYIKKLDPSAT